jgi:ribulose-5-phosphate 4-epimerase/fuculose-1-phosphate aldolase
LSETGAVKFQCEHVRVPLDEFAGFDELNHCRRELLSRGWIGVDENGIGFGNVSVRDAETSRFFISGSGTGAKRELTAADYTHVTAFDFDRNWLRCEGAIIASSESLTHAAVYESCRDARAVIHIHDLALWEAATNQIPSTPEGAEYGTPAMAAEVARLFATRIPPRQKFFEWPDIAAESSVSAAMCAAR